MEREMLERDSNPAVADADQDDRARLIGEILRDYVSGLGPDRAITSESVVPIRPVVDGIGSGRPRGTGRNALGIDGWCGHGQADCVRRISGSASTLGSHQRGIPPFARFQLDTVEGVRSSAAATLTVPPRSSIV